MDRWTRTRDLFSSLACASALVIAGGCIGERRPDAKRESRAKAARASQPTLVEMSQVDATLSHLIDGERVRVPYQITDPHKGAASPLVTIVEFSDFQCPFCGRLAGALDEVVANYPDDVRLVFKQFPLPMHTDAEPGARAALAAHRQGKFWQMHDALFANHRDMSRADLMTHGRGIGLDMKRFEKDLDSDALRQRVAADISLGEQLGIASTPTFFVNGRKLEGAMGVEAIKRIVEEERSKALALVDAGSRREEVYARIMLAAGAEKRAPDESAAAPRRPEPRADVNYAVPVGHDSPRRGPDDALVTVIELGTFSCDGCPEIAKRVDAVAARHPNVRFVFRHAPSADETSALAALSAHKQGKFWEARQRLLESGPIYRNAVPRLASEIGLDVQRFTRDFESDALKQQLGIDRSVAEKFMGALEGPVFFVNGRFLGSDATTDAFESLIREETTKAEAFLAQKRIARTKAFEAMRKDWQGYEIAQRAETEPRG